MDFRLKLHRALAFALVALLCACAAIDGTAGDSALKGALPQLPGGLLDKHWVAQVQTSHLTGAEAILRSPATSIVGSALQLTAAAGQPALEWAIWQLPVSAGSVPQSAVIDLNVDSGNSAWIGIANYSANTWELDGPIDADGLHGIAPLNATHVSPGGNMFVMVVAYTGTQLTVNGLEIAVDVPAPPKYFITGSLKDTRMDMGFVNQTVTLSPGNIQVATSGSAGNYTFIDLDPGHYTVFAPAIEGYDLDQVSIPVDLTSGNKTDANFLYTPQETAITYTNTIKQLFDTTCVECHNAATPGRARLDVYISGDNNDAFHNAEDALAYIMNNFMPWPPYDAWTMTQKQALQDWIQLYNKAE